MAGEGRKSGTATVVFTDLVGSTDLMTTLGDLRYDDLRGQHFARLREAVAAHDGHQVKNTGDGLLATFGSAADAVGAAVAIQQATERHARTAGVGLSVRVGVALGDVTFEDGDVFGTPVVEAARLVAAARPGQILATAVVRVVAGSRTAGARFTDVGALELKGLPEPVPACEVAWESSRASGVPLPVLMTGTGRVFVGREPDIERLVALWKEAAAGERRVGLVAGEPGVGKTRLAAELAGAVHREGAVVLAGRCDEDMGVPYQPFVEALRQYLDAVRGAELRLGRHAGELARLVPGLSELGVELLPPLQADPETERYRLFDAVAAWLADLSAESPVLLILDDLHWAAKPTLLLLRHVLRSADPLRLLVIATYRDTEVGRSHPLSEFLSDLRRHEGVERVSLTGLDVGSVTAYIEAAAGHAIAEEDEALPRAIWSETEGNPFFIGEVLRHLAETGGVVRRQGRWSATGAIEDLGIPEGVRDVVGRRLSRLSETTNRCLGLAAVVGVEFEPAVVAAAGGFDDEEFVNAVEEAAAARLLVEVPGPGVRYRFAHALVRATLYDELSAARRVALHRRVAEAIESVHGTRLDDHAPALAHHWARASAPAAHADRAVVWSRRAGDRALAQLAHDEAAEWYRSAVELLDAAGAPPEDRRRVGLLVDLGEAQRRAGDPDHRQTLLEAAALARANGDADTLARAALATHRGFFSASGAVDREVVAMVEAALEAVDPAAEGLRARLLANLAEELGFSSEHARRERLAEEALAIARRLEDPVTLAHVLARRYSTLPPLPERREEMVELAALATHLNDATLSLWAGLWVALTNLTMGDAERFERGLAAAIQRAEELGQPVLRWAVGFVHSGGSRLAGCLADAEAQADEALAVGQAAGVHDAAQIHAMNLFWVRYDLGRLDQMIDRFERHAAREHPKPLALASLALAYCELERRDDARRILDRVAVDRFPALYGNFTWTYGLAVLAQVCAEVNDAERAAILYDLLAPHQGLMITVGSDCIGGVDHYLGLLALTLGRLDEADAHFGSAAALHERIAAPTLLARTRLEWAQMTRRRAGGDLRARDLLHQALAGAVELGLGTIERRARALLGRP